MKASVKFSADAESEILGLCPRAGVRSARPRSGFHPQGGFHRVSDFTRRQADLTLRKGEKILVKSKAVAFGEIEA
jgi:hypothetical protein